MSFTDSALFQNILEAGKPYAVGYVQAAQPTIDPQLPLKPQVERIKKYAQETFTIANDLSRVDNKATFKNSARFVAAVAIGVIAISLVAIATFKFLAAVFLLSGAYLFKSAITFVLAGIATHSGIQMFKSFDANVRVDYAVKSAVA